MQPNPNPRRALLAQTARLIADHQPVALLELADLAGVSHGEMHRALIELEEGLGVIKNNGRMYEWRIHSPAHIAATIAEIAAGKFKPRRGAA
jgi:predicted transcriptional regulator